jgi:hypothetical protein
MTGDSRRAAGRVRSWAGRSGRRGDRWPTAIPARQASTPSGLWSARSGRPVAVLAGGDAAKTLTPDLLENGLVTLPAGLRTVDEYQLRRGADKRACD